MLLLKLRLSHTIMYTILIIPTIILVKDPLMPSLSHGMDMVDTGAANVAPLKLSHGTMEDMDTVDTGDKIKV